MRHTVLLSLTFFLVWTSFVIADVTLRTPEVSGRPEGLVLVPITIDDATGVASASITLTFDSNVVSANEVQKASLLDGFNFVSNIVGDEVRLAFANATGLPSGSGTVATLSFTVNPQAENGSSSTLTLSKAVVYDENAQTIATTVVNGVLTVDTTPPAIEIRTSLPAVKNGQSFTLTVLTESGLTVTADLSDLDITQTELMPLAETETTGTYTLERTINEANTAPNGIKTITVHVTDAAGTVAESATATIKLQNLSEFVLTIPQGVSLIHLPLATTIVNDQPMEIKTVGDLHNALGGAENVDLLITRDTATNEWVGFVVLDGTRLGDRTLTDDMGVIAVMKNEVPLRLRGDALGTGGTSRMNLVRGLNLNGVPLDDDRLNTVSDIMTLPGFEGKIVALLLSAVSGTTGEVEFITVIGADDPDGEIPITGGQSFIITATAEATAEITGPAWDNATSNPAAAPPVALVGHRIDEQTPVLAVHGAVVDEMTGMAKAGFRITVKNLSTGASLRTTSGRDASASGYSITFVDTAKSRAARVGDILEIHAKTPFPLVGVHPLRHIVTTDDVTGSRIRLPDLMAYEIPTETKLLPNYPNPFNPETWIPYRLAEDTQVNLTIYDATGRLVRAIHVGHKPAAVYESRAKAIYWDGLNDMGERVSSGVYFYHLKAGDFYATKKMLILK